MPPKLRITKDDIIEKSVEIVRRDGSGALNTRSVAKELGCSTQPIFSNFKNFGELRDAVISRANETYGKYVTREEKSGKYPPYKAQGMAYIKFASEERELFKLLYMRDRTVAEQKDESELEDIYGLISESVGISREAARLFHLETWAFVHGIAVMTATGYCRLDEELIGGMLTDVFRGLSAEFRERK